jgi:Flp pilus assembly protein TadG
MSGPVAPFETREEDVMTARPGLRRRTERGSVAVEFALVLPILMVLVFGIIDFGRAFNAQETLTQAAREGSRLAALCNSASPSTCGDVTSRTQAAAPNLAGMSVAPSVCAVGATSATDAVVTTTWTVSFSSPLVGLIPGFPSSHTLTGTGHMPCQG